MIFVTIGSMFPFDRLIRAMDAWAEANPGREMLAQIGDGGFEPAHMPWVRKLDRADYLRAVGRAELIVAHAGMGTVITAASTASRWCCCRAAGRSASTTTTIRPTPRSGSRTRPGIHVADDEAALPGLHRGGAAAPGDGGGATRSGRARRRRSSPGSAPSSREKAASGLAAARSVVFALQGSAMVTGNPYDPAGPLGRSHR